MTNPENTADLPRWRALVLFAVLLAGFAVLLVRGIYLQTIDYDFLKKKGGERYYREIEIGAHRGMITDRNGKLLAVSTPVESVWASPEDANADSLKLKQLAQVLGTDIEELKKLLFDSLHNFVYLKRYLPPDQAKKVQNLKLPGISLQHEYHRYYPSGEETAQVVGFTGHGAKGHEGLGMEGMELALQKNLAGVPGKQHVIKDGKGVFVEDTGSLSAPIPGKDIALSLDIIVQHIACRELESALKQHNANAGAVVVLDARSGEVLALANYPYYNPNNRDNIERKETRNRAVEDMFEPGSTMKPFTVATAIEIGKVRPDTMINTEHGLMIFGKHKIRDSHPEAMLTVAQVIQKSSNIGAAKIALSMEPKTLWKSLKASGFGEHTGSNFPGEALGQFPNHKDWSPIGQATVSYGHGMSVNLLQLARAYTVFANDGVLMPVSLIRLDKHAVGERVFSDSTAHALSAMLELVVQPGGTAPLAQIVGYRVAGKTGTAHKNEKGHYVNRYVASFVGFAPVSNPRLIVAVMIDEPRNGQYYGGLVAAPVFSKVMDAALHALMVSNDAPLNNVIAPSANIIKEGN